MQSNASTPAGSPEVSFVLSVFNGEAFLDACLDSIWSQSFGDLEVIAIDDGSTDSTPDILARHAVRDSRLRIITNQGNIGLAQSLNIGLEQARGPLIARIDADDQCLPERVEKQRAAFLRNPNLVLLGCNVVMYDASNALIGYTDLPEDDATIRAVSLLQNPFAHPAMMFRRAVLADNGLAYETSFTTTQDWDLWSRVMMHGQVANLPDVLLRQTMHSGSITARRRDDQQAHSLKVQTEHAQRMLGETLCPIATYETINEEIFSDGRDNEMHRENAVAAGYGMLDVFDRLRALRPALATPWFRRWVLRWCLRGSVKNLMIKGAMGLVLRMVKQHAMALPGAALGLLWARANKRI